MKILIISFIAISLISCSRPKHSLEIYLLKERTENIEGIPFIDMLKTKKIDSSNYYLLRYATYDTVNKSWIYAGEFDIKKSKLIDSPFIKNSEIEYLDLKRHEIHFSKSAAIKIGSLSGQMTYGHQFVLTDNKIPIFGGYFGSIFSSYPTNWNTIVYVHKIKNHKPKEDLVCPLIKQNGMKKYSDSKINFNEYRELIIALKETNRIKQ